MDFADASAIDSAAMATVAASPFVDERFLLLEALGHGGMGSVFSAFDRVDRKLVALKVLRDASPPGPAHPLAAEFEAWSRVRHPNVVRAYEMGRSAGGPIPRGTPYLVLEHVDGLPAHEALRPGEAEPAAIEELARHVLRALDHVHSAGLVHRDLKPGNVLVGPQRRGARRVKLTDFGLATRAGDRSEPGRLSGSLPYASPEALLGAPIDGRADLYALGILLHYLSSGALPFSARDPEGVIRWHLGGERGDPDPFGRMPDRFARFVRRLMAADREDRPASAAEALRALGETQPCRSNPTRPTVARSLRAALRLALDAARLGGRRALRLPPAEGEAAALVGEAHVVAQIHGLSVHRLTSDRGAAGSSLGRLVLRLLLCRGDDARALVERFGLERGLPLELLGGLPVWDRIRQGSTALHEPSVRHAVARGVTAFLLDSAARVPFVLIVDRGALGDPLNREVVSLLLAHAEEPSSLAPPRGGFLLLLPGDVYQSRGLGTT
jgi:hypothetical protein